MTGLIEKQSSRNDELKKRAVILDIDFYWHDR
jgi:hypothetical protein